MKFCCLLCICMCVCVCVAAILKLNSANNRKSCKYLNIAKVVKRCES